MCVYWFIGDSGLQGMLHIHILHQMLVFGAAKILAETIGNARMEMISRFYLEDDLATEGR